ncbi:fibronectin type III domain-containing protein [Chryseobacterium zhengzhouense]|uniref:Fibronectin type III domain-containing protein n=1 Tax=Chryseobacterium zhengzhouense TaxID=1636086 RepID=A0ABW2M409_9FLAO
MKRNQPALMLGALGILTSSLAFAQNFQTMPIQSGLTADVIANGVGSATTSTTTDVDGVSYAFVSQDFQATATSPALTYGLPTNGIINSVVTSTPGLSYVMANYSSNNSLKLSNQNDTGTIVFTTPKAAFRLYMLATSGSGASTVSVVVKFTDNTSQTFTGINISDWYDNTGFAIQGFGRINRNTNALETGSGTNPRLYQSLLTIDPANQSKLIQSVTITKTSTAQGHANIFAFSVDAYSSCPPPTLNAVGTITANSAAISWSPAAGTTPTTYDVYYNTNNTPPTSSTTANLPGVSGTSTTIPSLASNTTYYYWVRSNCTTTSQSAWSFSGNFKTLCGPMTSMSENFDSYNTGNIVPDCWVRNYVNGTMSISSSTPASGNRNIYQTTSTTQTPSTVVLPEFSNVNAGTHWLRFKARVSSASGTLNVGYVTNPTDASTFVLLQALSITNTNYTSANSEYTVIVPSSIPANARLAVRNTADGKGYYWDDVVWEAVPACIPPTAISTSAVTANTVTVSWTAPASAPANGYEYYYSTANTAPTATATISGTSAAGSVSKVVPGLNPATTYFMWIRSSCGTTSKSTWSYVGTFTTLCAAITPSYTNDFSTAPGNCWTNNQTGGTPATGPTGTTTSPLWVSGGFLNVGSANSMRINLYSVNRTGWLKTAAFDLSAGGYRVKFDYGVTAYNATGASAMGSDDNVQLLVSNDGGSTWTSLKTWNAASAPSNTSTTFSYDLVGYNSANTIFALYGTDGTADDNEDYDFHIDNFTVEAANLSTSEANAKNKEVKVYPNPFRDIVNISDIKEVKTVKVFDLNGRTLKTIENPTKEINLSSLNPGLYLITMYFKDGSQNTVKAIKK